MTTHRPLTDAELTRVLRSAGEAKSLPSSVLASVHAATSTASQRSRHRWLTPPGRPSMFSALKYVAAAAIVALFGGLLLNGVLTTPQDGRVIPAAGTASPDPSPAAEPSLRITFKPTDHPAVFEVISQPHQKWLHGGWQDRGSLGPLAIGSGESPWVQGWDTGGRAFLAQVGVPGRTKLWTTDDLALTPDGTLWAAGMKHNRSEDRVLASFDGESWTVRATDQPVVDLSLAADGTLYGITGSKDIALEEGVDVDFEKGVTRQLELISVDDGGLTTRMLDLPPGYDSPSINQPLALAVTSDGSLWVGGRSGSGGGVMADRWHGSLLRYEGQTAEVVRPLGDDTDPFVVGLAVGLDGDLWALMRTEADSYLGRFDGQDWTVYSTADGLPPVGVGFFADEVDRLAVGPDGGVWFSVIPEEEDEAPWGGLVVFDGQTFTRYLQGSWVSDFAIAPDGSVWTTDTLDQGIHVIRPDEVTIAQ